MIYIPDYRDNEVIEMSVKIDGIEIVASDIGVEWGQDPVYSMSGRIVGKCNERIGVRIEYIILDETHINILSKPSKVFHIIFKSLTMAGNMTLIELKNAILMPKILNKKELRFVVDHPNNDNTKVVFN